MGTVTNLRYEVFRPRVLSDWASELKIVRDGRILSESALFCKPDDIKQLLDLLSNPLRQLPIVAISRASREFGRTTLARPDSYSYRLFGNAHVVELDRRVSWSVTEEVGPSLSVFDGAVRIWWPQFSRDDDPHRHALILPDRLRDDPDRVESDVVTRIWRAAVDAIGLPAIETRVISSSAQANVASRIASWRDRTVDQEELLSELERQLRLTEEVSEKLDETSAECEQLRQRLAEIELGFEADEEADELENVASVEEAVRLAAGEAENVIFLPSAFTSAKVSTYPNPQRVLRDLRAILRVAKLWRVESLPDGFEGAFAGESVSYRPDISRTAKTKYRSDYEIQYAGQSVLMGPHLRRGIGPPASLLRIYWYVDTQTRQFVIGHVGRKLRDASNPSG